MNKICKLLLCAVLCLCLIHPAQAASQPYLTISTTEEFLTFAENCRLDSYSQGLTVSLEADIDLTGSDFSGIPIFCGTLNGRGHTIRGLKLDGEGSVQGLFRYLTQTALVRELTVEGAVMPQGSRTCVGGIVGSNAGTLERVRFRGDVTGADTVGGLVGINTVTGRIENGYMEGSVHGAHFVGGITGSNQGVLRLCKNDAQINTTPQQNTIGLSDITMDTLTDSESANTVTDIGGIAGTSTGVLRRCENRGNVGYRQMGYNIGGIAGSQSGYVTQCVNRGNIAGRKEVGGIVGHMEPAVAMEYSEDTLQQLQAQLDTVSALADRAAGSAQTGAAALQEQLTLLQTQTDTAGDAVSSLLPDPDNPQQPDADAILAAQGTLSDSFSSISGTIGSISTSAGSSAAAVSSDIRAMADQLSQMEQTLQTAEETLNAEIYDASDEDTPDTLTGKVETCRNLGHILGDLNIGGITGAMALENDLDSEEDVEVSGTASLNFQCKLRAVILGCENTGTITVMKQNAGGIAGWQSMGLVKNVINGGTLLGENASYVGGIAGQSSGYIRNCFSTGTITGNTKVGGIAGSGNTVTDCRAMNALSAAEASGAILGSPVPSENDASVAGNYYLPVSADPGGIDGVSYASQAQPLTVEEFLALEELPTLFRQSTVTFNFPDGSKTAITVLCGKPLTEIPALPEQAGFSACWEGLEEANLSAVFFDMEFSASYTAHDTVIASSSTRQDRPVLLVQGDFSAAGAVTAEQVTAAPPLEQRQQLLESWRFTVTGGTAHTARFLLPEKTDGLTLFVYSEDGIWQQAEADIRGNYFIFPVSENTRGFALVHQSPPLWYWYAAGVSLLAALLVTMVLFLRRTKTQ